MPLPEPPAAPAAVSLAPTVAEGGALGAGPVHHPADLVSQHLLPGVGVLFAVYLAVVAALVLVTAVVKTRLKVAATATGRPAAHRAARPALLRPLRPLRRASRRTVVVLPAAEEQAVPSPVAGGAV